VEQHVAVQRFVAHRGTRREHALVDVESHDVEGDDTAGIDEGMARAGAAAAARRRELDISQSWPVLPAATTITTFFTLTAYSIAAPREDSSMRRVIL
jgi:hypothetical protein